MNENWSQSKCENVYECDYKMKTIFLKKWYFLNREWKTIMNKNGSQSKCENVYQCGHKKKIKFQKDFTYSIVNEKQSWKKIEVNQNVKICINVTIRRKSNSKKILHPQSWMKNNHERKWKPIKCEIVNECDHSIKIIF